MSWRVAAAPHPTPSPDGVRRARLTREETALEAAAEALARLDQTLKLSDATLRDAWRRRAILEEAAAALQLEGEMMVPERLALHEMSAAPMVDAAVRRAACFAAALRWMAGRPPAGLLSAAGIVELCARLDGRQGIGSQFSALNSAERDAPVAAWWEGLESPKATSPCRRAASLEQAWAVVQPADRLGPVPGRLLAVAALADAGRLRAAFHPIHVGLRAAADPLTGPRPTPLERFCAALMAGARRGLALHAELGVVRELLTRAAAGRRQDSALPRAAEAILAQPAFTASGLGRLLKVSERTARTLVEVLAKSGALRELTGRSNFRYWATALEPMQRRPAPKRPARLPSWLTSQDGPLSGPSIYDLEDEA